MYGLVVHLVKPNILMTVATAVISLSYMVVKGLNTRFVNVCYYGSLSVPHTDLLSLSTNGVPSRLAMATHKTSPEGGDRDDGSMMSGTLIAVPITQ